MASALSSAKNHSGQLTMLGISLAMLIIPFLAAVILNVQQYTIPLMKSSVIIGVILLLKTYLKALYGLSEEYALYLVRSICKSSDVPRKCSKFVSGKKTAIGDKPANKRHEKAILWERLPFATTPLLTTNDVHVQKTRVSSVASSFSIVLTF
jgi:cohesin loading factor subunit SCC2